MSPTQARTFYAVAKAGSFTGAAKSLHVSQPTVTTQIRDLEALYQVELFHRHARGVTLTHTGEALLAIIRRIHINQQDAIEFLRATQGLRTGHLRIGAYAPYPAIKILAAFNRSHPELEVSLHFANSRTLEEELSITISMWQSPGAGNRPRACMPCPIVGSRPRWRLSAGSTIPGAGARPYD